MSRRIVVDPVTRIEGHLRIEVEVSGGKVVDAWSSGTMARGFEKIIEGKDPRDATYVTERICGVCAGSHGWVSSLALDQAHGAKVPSGGRLIRNLILGAMWLHDHPLHFYHLSALDYIDIMAVAGYTGSDRHLNEVKAKMLKLVEMGDTAPLTPRYEPDEFCVSDPDIVMPAVAHYIEALEIQAKAKKMSAVFAGKQPHQSSIVVGGVTEYPDAHKLAQFRSLLDEVAAFCRKVYIPDVIAFGTGPLLPLAQAGVGDSGGGYLAYGAFDLDDDGREKLFKPGVISGNDTGHVKNMDQSLITEDVKYSWYKDSTGRQHPMSGETDYDLDKASAYSFLKAPRYNGEPMEVGPLARMLVMCYKPLMELMETYGVKPGAVARHAARALETELIIQGMYRWLDELTELAASDKLRIHDTAHWDPPEEAEGVGLHEAPRGALGHWLKIKGKRIEHYQMIVPTTWNCSPRDEKGRRGPVEQALIGTPVPDPENPINLVRVVRSFDPCLACAVHLIEPESNRVLKFRVI